VINKQCATTSEETYSSSISRARLARTRQHDILNSHKKSMTSLLVAIAIMDEFNRQIDFNGLKKSVTSLSAAIGALGSPLGPHLKSDLEIDLYSVSTPIAIKTSMIAGWLYPSSQL
jgi:hypothetical protein